MKWKEFLKPNWKKFSIFLIIYFLDSLINLSVPFFGTNINILNLFLYNNTFVLSFILQYSGGEILLAAILWSLFLLLNLIYQYVISCVIIWIYDKVKAKK